MDPLRLLRELYGEESIRKVVTSGFDSVGKIAAASPESLSFFAGVTEVLARQIVASAEEVLGAPASAGYRGALAGSAQAPAEAGAVPVKPKAPAARPPAGRRVAEPRGRSKPEPLDEKPIVDAGGLLKTIASEPLPKELLDPEDLLDEVGITDAEADFLEGISPWSAPSGREKTSPEPPEPADEVPAPPTEYAPVSDWSPEKEPDPIPRIVRAPELGPDPNEEGVIILENRPKDLPAQQAAGPEPPEKPERIEPPEEPPAKPAFWKFGH